MRMKLRKPSSFNSLSTSSSSLSNLSKDSISEGPRPPLPRTPYRPASTSINSRQSNSPNDRAGADSPSPSACTQRVSNLSQRQSPSNSPNGYASNSIRPVLSKSDESADSLSMSSFGGYDDLSSFAASLGDASSSHYDNHNLFDDSSIPMAQCFEVTTIGRGKKVTISNEAGKNSAMVRAPARNISNSSFTSPARRGKSSKRVSAENDSSEDERGRQIHQTASEHLKKGNLKEALFLFKEILKTQQEQYKDEDNRCVGAALHNVGIVHLKGEDYKSSLRFFEDAVRVRKGALGTFHADVASSLVKFGIAQLSLKDHDAANESFREALRIRRKLSKKGDDQHVAQILSHIGLLHFEYGELLAAVSFFEEALSIKRTYKQDIAMQISVSETLCSIGTIRSKRKQFGKAIVAFEGAMEIQRKCLGEEHVSVLNTMDNLAFAYSKNGNQDNALKIYKKMLRAQVAKYGESHMECAGTLAKMSIVHEKQKNYAAAFGCTKEVQTIQESKLDYDHPDVLCTKNILARIVRQMDKF